jgi:hypothetical protein
MPELTIRETRNAPPFVCCWVCGYERLINDDCIVSECPSCADSSYEYDVPPTTDQVSDLLQTLWPSR